MHNFFNCAYNFLLISSIALHYNYDIIIVPFDKNISECVHFSHLYYSLLSIHIYITLFSPLSSKYCLSWSTCLQ